ncbi:hypothetical protein ACTL6U_18260 [Rhodovibrionaceae bacterium A322]
MLLISYGITKSGSTLAFELSKAILDQAGHKQLRLDDAFVTAGHKVNFIDSVSEEKIENLIREIGPDRTIAVKTHREFDPALAPYLSRKIEEGHLLVQANFRDPREVCLSLLDAGVFAREKKRKAFAEMKTMTDAVRGCHRQIKKLRQWGALPKALPLYYNDVAYNTDRVIAAIDAQLGTNSDYEAVKKQAFDSFTQKNKAVRNRYETDLNAMENNRLLEEFGDFILRVCVDRDYSWFTEPLEA